MYSVRTHSMKKGIHPGVLFAIMAVCAALSSPDGLLFTAGGLAGFLGVKAMDPREDQHKAVMYAATVIAIVLFVAHAIVYLLHAS